MLINIIAALVFAVSSWQVYDSNTGILTVHYGQDSKSQVCFQGKVEDYPGTCTKPAVRNPEYENKQYMIRHGLLK